MKRMEVFWWASISLSLGLVLSCRAPSWSSPSWPSLSMHATKNLDAVGLLFFSVRQQAC